MNKFKEGDIVVHLTSNYICRVLGYAADGLLQLSYSIADFGNAIDTIEPEADFELESVLNSDLQNALIEDEQV